MSYEIEIPKDQTQAEDVIKNLVTTGEAARAVHEVQWYHTHHYLQGARDFTGFNFETGSVDVNYVNEMGMLQFRCEDIVSKYQAQIGRLLQMDLNPKVKRKNIGLEDMKNATIAQIALRSIITPTMVKSVHMAAVAPMTKYGCVGLAVWNDGAEMGIDVVMPWELLPIPSRPLEDSEARGIIRARWVPLEWVKGLSYVQEKSVAWDKMEKQELPVGSEPSNTGGRLATFGGTAAVSKVDSTVMGGRGTRQDKTQVPMVQLVELWTWSQRDSIKEYLVMAGGSIIYRKNYTDSPRRIPIPIRVAVDIPTGGFYGRGFLSTLIPLNTEIEYSLGRLFQNLQDFDAYGILCVPTTMGVPPELIRAEDGTRRLVYAPDYTQPNLQPFNIEPANAGPLPAKAVAIAMELNSRIANQPTELLGGRAPGRVDSKGGLGLLYEISNTPLTATAMSLSAAFRGCYEAMLALLPSVWTDQRVVEVAILDDAMAGVQIDPTRGTITLNAGLNAIPHPDAVEITVVSMMPVSKEQEKAELANALSTGVIDMVEYVIEVRRRDLDLPVGHEIEWQNWRRAVMNNIILFADGVTPGQTVVNDYDMHDIHMRVIRAFIARPEFYAASHEVRQKFTDVLEAHQARVATFPEQLPYPEEAALDTEASARAGMTGPPQL